MDIGNKQSLLVDILNSQPFQPIKIKQWDKNTRQIDIQLTDGSSILNIPPGLFVKFQATKPDGKIIFADCTYENNIIHYTATEHLTEAAGYVKCEIGLYSEKITDIPKAGEDQYDGLIQSATFKIYVEESAMDRNAVKSSDDYQTLTVMINYMTGLVAKVELLMVNAEIIIEKTQEAADLMNDINEKVTKAEEQRVLNEQIREGNESLRIQHENIRISNEETRVLTENTRILSENERLANETARVSEEQKRDTAEVIRLANEVVRIDNENDRIANENDRIIRDEARPDYVYLTQAEYDALTPAQKADQSIFYEITDDDGQFPDLIAGLINDALAATSAANDAATSANTAATRANTAAQEAEDAADAANTAAGVITAGIDGGTF